MVSAAKQGGSMGVHPEQAARKADEQQEQARPHSQVHLHTFRRLSLCSAVPLDSMQLWSPGHMVGKAVP